MKKRELIITLLFIASGLFIVASVNGCSHYPQTPEKVAIQFYEPLKQKGMDGIDESLKFVDPDPVVQSTLRIIISRAFQIINENEVNAKKYNVQNPNYHAVVLSSEEIADSTTANRFSRVTLCEKGREAEVESQPDLAMAVLVHKVNGKWYVFDIE